MLVISRQEDQAIVIGDPSNPLGRIVISRIRGDRVRLALEFPRHIDIHRAEVAQQIIAERAGQMQAVPA